MVPKVDVSGFVVLIWFYTTAKADCCDLSEVLIHFRLEKEGQDKDIKDIHCEFEWLMADRNV